MRNRGYHIPDRKAAPPEARKPIHVPLCYYRILQQGQEVWSGTKGALDWLFSRDLKPGKQMPDSLTLIVKTTKQETKYFFNKS
jgi:hypothetical protein